MARPQSVRVAGPSITAVFVVAALVGLPANQAQGSTEEGAGPLPAAGRAENLTAANVEAEGATVQWDVVAACGPEVTSTAFYEAPGVASAKAEAEGRGAGHRSLTLRSLEPESEYRLHVVIEGECGTASASPAITFTTPSRPPWKAAALASVALLAVAGLVWFARRRV